MKKGSIALGSMMLGMLTGYGAWCMYKKLSPESARELKGNVEKNVKKMTRKVDKFTEDMM